MHNIPILELQSVEKHFPVARSRGFWSSRSHTNRVLKAVNKVSFSIFPGETMGLVGESGCGKSTVARLIAGLDSPNSGEILLNGKALPKKLSYKIQKAYRSGVEMIFQDPYASLDPRWRVKQIIAEPIKEYHLHHDRKEIYDNVNKLLTLVGLSPEDGEKYPHEFSRWTTAADLHREITIQQTKVTYLRRTHLGFGRFYTSTDIEPNEESTV